VLPNGIRIALTISVALVACRSDAPTVARRPASLVRISGDGQSAPPGEPLEQPLVARLVDADGRPVRRVDVRWSASAGDVSPAISATDANGEARAVWKLGTEPGPQRAIAIADGLDPVAFVAFVDPNALPDRLPLRAIALETYDGSGQVVHPDIATPTPEGVDGSARLAITPYPWGNASYENPSLFEGNGRDAWAIPPGITNPVAKPSGGYLSDPDILWVPEEREFWLYYRHVDDGNEILVSQSRDGAQWGPPRVVVRVPSHQAVSPTVVRRSATDWLMWTVNAGAAGCASSGTTVELRRSTDGLMWTSPTTARLTQPGFYPWHLEVQWIPSRQEYWALYNGKVAGSCTTDALFFATSADGVTWKTYASPILRRGAIPELADVVYRATFSYDPQHDVVSLWHSGARYTSRGYEWHAAFERRRRADLFDAATGPAAAMLLPSSAPPLTNATAP
jgi:hypothetical protein